MKDIKDYYDNPVNEASEETVLCRLEIGDCEGNYEHSEGYIRIPKTWLDIKGDSWELAEKTGKLTTNTRMFIRVPFCNDVKKMLRDKSKHALTERGVRAWDPHYYNYGLYLVDPIEPREWARELQKEADEKSALAKRAKSLANQ